MLNSRLRTVFLQPFAQLADYLRERPALLIVLVASLLFKLIVWAIARSIPEAQALIASSPDGYDMVARCLATHGFFCIHADQPVPEIETTPGYPAFLALIYRTFGFHYAPVQLAQIILSVMSVGVLFRIAERLFDASAARLAAIIAALDVTTIALTQIIFTETLFTFVFSFALLNFIVLLQRGPRQGLRNAFKSIPQRMPWSCGAQIPATRPELRLLDLATRPRPS